MNDLTLVNKKTHTCYFREKRRFFFQLKFVDSFPFTLGIGTFSLQIDLNLLISRFIIKDKETFFTNAQRSLLVHELLLRTRYEPEKDKFGK